MHTICQFHYQTLHPHHTMKTSVVLLALATAALAAPAHHEEAFKDEHQTPAKLMDGFTRERKSTLESSSSPNPGSPVNLPSSSQNSEFGVSGRSFNLQKPIIIKKKVGSSYQVYRDSDEEKLDSPEPCMKQVRVKLCEDHNVAKSSDMMKSSTIEDPKIHMTEDDMKHSIMLAKEAIETIQKDLRKIEHTPAKTAPWKHGDSESDVELHQDIEVARQALEHIHNNFGILEVPNSHDTSVKEAEIVEDVAFPLAQTEEERLAQWKEAIDNIHRNVELVKNIEDSFKSTQDNMSHTDEIVTPMKDINKHELHKPSVKDDMRVTENVEIKEEHKPMIEDLEHSKIEKSNEQNEMKSNIGEKDMMESASMVSATKLQELNHNNKARLTPQLMKDEHIAQAKDGFEKFHGDKHAVDTMTLDSLPQTINIMSLQTAEEDKERKTEANHLEKSEKVQVDSLMNNIKSIDSGESLLENQRNVDNELHGTTAHNAFKQDELKNIGETEDKHIVMKSAEHITDKHDELIKDEGKMHEGHQAMTQFKQAGGFATGSMGLPSDMKKDNPSLTGIKSHENMVQKDHSFVEGKMTQTENSMVPAMTSDSLVLQHKPMMGNAFEMKATEDMKNMEHQQLDQAHMRWAQDKTFNTEMGSIKSAAETHQVIDHPKKMHPGHHHAHHHPSPHHLDASHGHLRHPDQLMTHAKSADMDNVMQSNYFMNMRDSNNQGQDGHTFRWRPKHQHSHDSARSAYGAPVPASSPTSGAVGLFPNANIGGCGIPLLLSCNPSVVSGSLAKAHPASYSAPAYRTEDDFNFHSKRDVKKTENLVNTLNKTPKNPISKTSTVLVAKQ